MNTDDTEQADRARDDKSLSLSLEGIFVERLGDLKRALAGMGLGPTDAEDILQDVFIQASKREGEFFSPEELVRWLIRVTVNRGMLEFRRRRRFRKAVTSLQQRTASEADSPADGTDSLPILVEKLEAVRQALRELDERLLSPLVLRYFCELDATQISRILKLPASTVRSRLREARLILAERLIERDVEP